MKTAIISVLRFCFNCWNISGGGRCCRCEANYILMINTMLLALCMFIVPFCQVLPALAFVLAVMGFNMGSVDTLANLQMVSVFGDAVPPFLQVIAALIFVRFYARLTWRIVHWHQLSFYRHHYLFFFFIFFSYSSGNLIFVPDMKQLG